MTDGLDNLGSPEEGLALLKRSRKALTKTNNRQRRGLAKALDQLERLVPLAQQALIHVGPGDELKADLFFEINESKALLRDQGRKIT